MSLTSQHNVSWLALYDEFVSAKKLAGHAHRTIEWYVERTRPFVVWLCDRPLTRSTIRQYLAEQLQPRMLAPSTLHGHVRAISSFCSWLVEERHLDHNPAAKLAPKLPKRRPAHYTRDQLLRLLAVCDLRDRAIVLAFLDTGLRREEFIQLRRDRIDWQTGAFTVIGKGNEERPGWFEPITIAAIRVYLDTRRDDHPALWYGRSGPLTGSGIWQLLKRRCLQAGIRTDVRRLCHAFRANFGKHYLEAGGDLESLRELYGHHSLQMTSYYAQLSTEPLRRKKAAVNPLAVIIQPD